MKTKLDFYHMTPFYELNYFIAFIVKLYKRIQQRKEQKEHRIKDELVSVSYTHLTLPTIRLV